MRFLQRNLSDFLMFVWKPCFEMSMRNLKNKTELKKDQCEALIEVFLKEILLIFKFLCGHRFFK